MVQSGKKVKAIFAGRLDLIFIMALLVFSAVAWIQYQRESSSQVKVVTVMVHTDPVQHYAIKMPVNKTFEVVGRIGSATLEFTASGAYRISSSACPHKICVNYGWARRGSVICVPNGLVVSGESAKEDVDAITR